MRLIKAGAILALALPLVGQTTVPPSQLRESSALQSSPSQIRLYAVDPTKQGVISVKPGAGLSLRSTPEGWVLEATAMSIRMQSRTLTRNAAGNYPVGLVAIVYRNGLIMSLGLDYTHNGEAVIPLQPWASDDTVVAVQLVVAAP